MPRSNSIPGRNGACAIGRAARLAAVCAVPLLAFAAPVAAQQGPAPVGVVVDQVHTARIVDRVEALGTLRANEAVDVTALVTEQIHSLHFDDGDRAARGDVLVELLHREETALLEEAEAARAEAEEQLRRAQELADRGAGTAEQLSLRRRQFAVSEARIRAVEARIADRVIRAPFDGRVGIRTISVGATVEPGDVIVRFIDDTVMKLDFSVPTTFLAKISEGLEIEARGRAFDGEAFTGRVASIDSEVDPVTRSVLVRAEIPNPEGRLRPGLLMEVSILLDPRETLLVAEEALIPLGSETYVLVAEEADGQTRAQRRRIQIGARQVGWVEVLDGLSAGERVVTRGGLKVRPGRAIAPREEGRTPPGAVDAPDAPNAREGEGEGEGEGAEDAEASPPRAAEAGTKGA